MKRTTKKLSGIALELFLRRFFLSYSGIDEPLARQLAQDGTRAFASVRVRRNAWHHWRRRPDTKKLQGNSVPSSTPPAMAAPSSRHPIEPTSRIEQTAVSQDVAAFDPYALGLVPTFQRKGADGLLAKLADISSIDDLRKMARAQQVALPAELRGADADINAIRQAIVEAVGKRIANRRAAAG